MTRETILKDIIYPSFAESLAFNPNAGQIEVNEDTVLFGKGAVMDSIGLVTLIGMIESALQDKAQVNVSLATESAMSRSKSPFKTIGSIADYAFELISAS